MPAREGTDWSADCAEAWQQRQIVPAEVIGGLNAAVSIASKLQLPSCGACRHFIVVADNALLLENDIFCKVRLIR